MSNTSTSTSQAQFAAWTFFGLVMLSYSCVVLLATNPPPFVDFPDWVYQGVLFHGVLTGHPIAGYALKHYPVPNSTTTICLGLLDTILPWQWAAKLWVVMYFALASFSTWLLSKALHLQAWQLIVAIPGILFLNLNFWYGHISFEIGLCLVMLLAALLIRHASQTSIAILLTAIFFTHMEACAGALLLLAVWVAFTHEARRLWTATLPALLTLWYAIARFTGGNADSRGIPPADFAYGSGRFLIYKANTFAKTFGYVNSISSNGLSQTERFFGRNGLLVLIVLSLCIAGFALFAIFRAIANLDSLERRVLGTFALLLLLISLFLPQAILGTFDPGSRLLLMAAATGFYLVDWPRKSSTLIAILSIVFCLINLLQLAKIERNPTIPGHQRDLPVALTTYGHVQPDTRIIDYQRLQQGEMDLDIFSTAMFLRTSR